MKKRFFFFIIIIFIIIIFSTGCHKIGGPGGDQPPPPIPVDQLPTLSVQLDRDPAIYDSGDTVEVIMDASDDSGSVTVTMTLDGTDVPVNLPTTSIDTTGFPVGSGHTVYVTATDPSMNSTKVSLIFTIRDPDDVTFPIVSINSPGADSEITAPVDIFGTASDDNFVYFTLEYAPAGKTNYTPFSTDTASVNNDVLGVFDPTLLLNGLYSIRLTATDANGLSSSTSIVYLVKGDLKLGHFSLALKDLSIPVAGIPITIKRTYDTRIRHDSGDFGYGWNLDIRAIKLEENREMGEGWYQQSSGGLLPTYYLLPNGLHCVSITLPNGKVMEFECKFMPESSVLVPIQWIDSAVYTPRFGTDGSLVALDDTPMYFDGTQILNWDFEIYNPDRYQMTTIDGTVYNIDQNEGLTQVTDNNGNALSITNSGIMHSSGKVVTFTRDSQDRITHITDPLGNTIQYEYDLQGDLTSVIDQEGNMYQYTYNSTHRLVEIIDPRGITSLRNEYDDSGRLIAQIDADGNRTEYDYDIDTRQEVITDPRGGVTVNEYDDIGNALRKTDPHGNTITFTYDSQGNKISETNALGNTFTYTYDSHGNLLTETDPLGNTITYTYNARGQELLKTDPLGNVTTRVYDSKGNLLSTTDPLGNSTTFTYDTQGNKTSETDALGNTLTYTYDSYGNLLSEIDALGNTTMYTHDANGNVLTKTDSNGDTVNYNYDALNRLAYKTYPDATTVSFTYTATGKYSAVTDPRGTSSYNYDAMNRLTQVFNPDGTGIFYTYDAMGNKTSMTVSSGVTTYTYDALNNLLTVTDPDVGVTYYSYNAAGNCISVNYPNGCIIEYEYDALNHLIYLENKKSTGGIVSSYSYSLDAIGNRVSVVESSGRTVIYTYDSLSRVIQEDITDSVLGNQTISYTYDAVGNRLTKTDQSGTTNYTYDANNRLIARGNYLYTYDNNGNTLSENDGFNSSTYTYDYENRLISAQKLGSVIGYTYDADGIRVSSTVNSVVTKFITDKNNYNTQVLEERDGSGNLMVRYVYGNDLISQKRDNILSFYIYDGIGSTRQLIDISEVLTDTHVFDTFGIELNRTGTTINKYLFIGEQYDSDIGFYYLEGRYYDQETGRFITQN
jgi:YD repeat-containing protein